MASRRWIGFALIVFAIAFNAPYAWLARNFDYPNILRQPPGDILLAFGEGGASLILAWLAFAAAALLFAPIALAVAAITRDDATGARADGVAALGVAAAVTQATGLARWAYAVPVLASMWRGDPADRLMIETQFAVLHQFAGVGIGEAIGQTLTAFWLFGVGCTQARHPRFGWISAGLAWIGGLCLLLGLSEGAATVIAFDPGVTAMGAMVGFLVLTLWLIWTGARVLFAPREQLVSNFRKR